MGFDLDFLFKSFDIQEEEVKKFNVAENNLNSIEDFIEFFTYLGILFKNKELVEIELFMKKLNYLGYTYNNLTSFDYNDAKSIELALVQFAFILNLDINNEKASLCYFTCIELLKQF